MFSSINKYSKLNIDDLNMSKSSYNLHDIHKEIYEDINKYIKRKKKLNSLVNVFDKKNILDDTQIKYIDNISKNCNKYYNTCVYINDYYKNRLVNAFLINIKNLYPRIISILYEIGKFNYINIDVLNFAIELKKTNNLPIIRFFINYFFTKLEYNDQNLVRTFANAISDNILEKYDKEIIHYDVDMIFFIVPKQKRYSSFNGSKKSIEYSINFDSAIEQLSNITMNLFEFEISHIKPSIFFNKKKYIILEDGHYIPKGIEIF